jgi:CRP-like cAMP-binding protein
MISSYSSAQRRQLLSKHFLISTMSERALDDLVRYATIARFEPHGEIFGEGDPGDCRYGILSGRVRIYSTSPEGGEIMPKLTRAGDAVAISAYLGNGTEFDKAIAQFAVAYAGQTERDWGVLCDAIEGGRISAARE